MFHCVISTSPYVSVSVCVCMVCQNSFPRGLFSSQETYKMEKGKTRVSRGPLVFFHIDTQNATDFSLLLKFKLTRITSAHCFLTKMSFLLEVQLLSFGVSGHERKSQLTEQVKNVSYFYMCTCIHVRQSPFLRGRQNLIFFISWRFLKRTNSFRHLLNFEFGYR